MTEDELLHEAALFGIENAEEQTIGELAAAVSCSAERERRFFQQLSVIAYRQAVLTAKALAGERLGSAAEVFPFWTEEEVAQAKLAYYKEKMDRIAGGSGK